MRTPPLSLTLALLLLAAPPRTPAAAADNNSAASARQRLRMDADWRFQIDAAPATAPKGTPVADWQWRPAEASLKAGSADQAAAALPADTGWQNVQIPTGDLFHGRPGFVWLRATLPAVPVSESHQVYRLHFESVDDNATVYLNGKKLAHHQDWNDPFDVVLPAADWKSAGPNLVTVLDENVNNAGGMPKPVTIQAEDEGFVPEPARESFDDHAWRTVHLPHDYVVEGTFDSHANEDHGFLPTPPAWYRRTFQVPADWQGKSVWIDFDGIYTDAHIYLNGKFLDRHRSGYIGARFDLSQALHYGGANTLAIHVDPSKFEGWWYEGGGIYRHVWLNVAAPVHIEPDSVFVRSDVADVEDGSAASANVRIAATLVRPPDAPNVTMQARVVGPDGRQFDAPLALAAAADGKVHAEGRLTVPQAQLWSLEQPQLYRLLVTVVRDGKTEDAQEVPFGIRTIHFDPDRGFLLNGKPVKIQGTCNHQDFAGIGIALTDDVLEWRVRQLKAMGANAYRTSHNPVAPELLDAFDRLGMLVMDETRHFGDTYAMKTPNFTAATDLTDFTDMVRRDRNHPSVILWSIANEEYIQQDADSEPIARAMKARVDALDGTRPVTAAQNMGGYTKAGIDNVVDVFGFNYNPDGYDRFHRERPQQPIVGSETGSAVTTRGCYALIPFQNSKGHFFGDPTHGWVTAYDLSAPGWAETAEDAWKPIAQRPFVSGGFVWTGFDYRGEPTPFNWPCISSQFGIMDTCGFPKDDYYYYLAWWGGKPLVHLLPHWNWPANKGEVLVHCLGNCAKVELFLNGRSLGTKPMPLYGHLDWKVPYEAGRLEARGYGVGTQVLATDVVETTGPAAALRLAGSRAEVTADGEGTDIVSVTLHDASGRVVPTADNEVSFAVTGPGTIAGVGNGDPSCLEPDKADKRQAFNGRCLVVVQTKAGGSGTITLTATSPGLAPATLTVPTVPAQVKDVE